MLSQFEIKLKKSVQSLENKIAKKILVKEPPPHKCVAAKEHGKLVDLRACQGRAPPPPPMFNCLHFHAVVRKELVSTPPWESRIRIWYHHFSEGLFQFKHKGNVNDMSKFCIKSVAIGLGLHIKNYVLLPAASGDGEGNVFTGVCRSKPGGGVYTPPGQIRTLGYPPV